MNPPPVTTGACLVCGARTRHPNNFTCGFRPCREEFDRLHPPPAPKRRPRVATNQVSSGHKTRNLLYDSKLHTQ